MFTLFTAIVFLQLNGALYDSIGDYSADFELALQLPFQNESINIGESAFNQLFWNSYHHIIKRECASCLATHRVIYYKRNTKTHSFNAYVLMTRWFGVDNRLDLGDFDLFSSLSDAFNQTNEWKYCFNNGNDIAGAFRDCGPNARVYNQWASTDPTASGKPSNFFIYIPADTPVTDTTSNTPTFSPIAVSTKEQSAVTMLITNDESGRNPYENAKDDTLIYAYLAIALCVVCCICGSVYSAKRFWKHKQSTKPQAKALSVQSEEEIVANNIDSNNDDTVNKQRQSVDNASTDDVQNTVIPVNDDRECKDNNAAGKVTSGGTSANAAFNVEMIWKCSAKMTKGQTAENVVSIHGNNERDSDSDDLWRNVEETGGEVYLNDAGDTVSVKDVEGAKHEGIPNDETKDIATKYIG